MDYKINIVNAEKLKLKDRSFEKSKICESILRSLPQWFGIENALLQYVEEIKKLPTLLAVVGDEYAGFLSFKQHNKYTAELYVMAIYPKYHRQGIGRALIHHTESILCQQGFEYWQVKTLAPSHPSPFYGRTRDFYQAMGFRPLEEFTKLWGEDNPCLIMIKYLPLFKVTVESLKDE